jgi:hypothetical protein
MDLNLIIWIFLCLLFFAICDLQSELFQSAEEEITFNVRVLVAIASVYGVFAYRRCVQFADSTLIRFCRIGCADELAE